MRLYKFINFYKTAAIIFFNTVIFFIICNVFLLGVILLKDGVFLKKDRVKMPSEQLENVPLEKVYPGYNIQEIDQILKESWDRGGLEFEEFTHFKERAFRGKYVNVSQVGYRYSVPQGKWPPDPKAFNIFLFGGSTTFGYGVSDNETIATYLQKELRSAFPEKNIWIYNFGRGYYYSAQESVLFQRLLMHDYSPDMAIFIDGLNDFVVGYEDKPSGTDNLYKYVEKQNKYSDSSISMQASRIIDNIQPALYRFYYNLPVVRLVNYFKRLNNHQENNPSEKPMGDAVYSNRRVLEGVINRYFAQKKIIEGIAENHHILPIFVIQPVPNYKYNFKYDFKYKEDSDSRFKNNKYCDLKCYTLYGYPLLEAELKNYDSSNILWLADMQEGQKKPLYVDNVHYTADMSRQIAHRMKIYLEKKLF